MSVNIRNIPTIMRSKGWSRGATLMERWFRNASTQYPAYASADTSTITMNWVTGYTKPKQLYDSIFTDQIWANEAARGVLRTRLSSWGMLGNQKFAFDQTVQTPAFLESQYINFRGYGGGYSGYSGSGYSGSGYSGSGYSGSGYSGSGYSGASGGLANQSSGTTYGGLNDLIAALGAFTFRVVLAGSVAPTSNNQYQIEVTKVGVYLRDSYDFQGFQFLGFWNDSNNSVSAINPLSGSAVFNSTFRNWRDQNEAGGDYLVYSNVQTKTLSRPHVFTL